MSKQPLGKLTIDTGLALAYRDLEDARLAQASFSRNKANVDAIRHHRANGMSRTRLEQIYGKQLVYIAIQQGDE